MHRTPISTRLARSFAHEVLVAVGSVFAEQLEPLGTRHDLHVVLQAGVYLRAVDYRAAGRVVGHLLQGYRGAQRVSGKSLATLGHFGRHAHLVVRREAPWRQASMRRRSSFDTARSPPEKRARRAESSRQEDLPELAAVRRSDRREETPRRRRAREFDRPSGGQG